MMIDKQTKTENNMRNDKNYMNDPYEDGYDGGDYGYTQDELDAMYEAAFEGDPDAQWNID